MGPISNFGPGGNAAQVRFVNGSPDAGPVQVSLDNQQQFCTSGATGSACALNYGTVTGYIVNLNAGSHAIVLRDQNNNTITIPNATVAVNSGYRYTIALVGETHPSASGHALGVVTIQEQPFSTPSGGSAVNFNNASPSETAAAGGHVQFGYATANSTAPVNVGAPIGVGAETNPSAGGIPSSSLNVPITFFASSQASGITVTPSQIDAANCSSNALPCGNNEMNLSLYLIDGPADSTTPIAGPYPIGFSTSTKAGFVGAFDPNG